MDCEHFNRPFRPFFKAAHPGLNTSALFGSPIVKYSLSGDVLDEKSLDGIMDDSDWSLRLPFQRFRVRVFAGEPGDFDAIAEQVGTDDKQAIRIVVCLEKGRYTTETGRSILQLLIHGRDIEQWECELWNGYTYKKVCGSESFSLISGKQQVKAVFGIKWLAPLCVDFFTPTNFLAKVCPDPKGRSIIWERAHSHYVLIHKTHAANKREVQPGAVVNSEPQIERMAHSRRAHFRLLKSPKFRLKQGQRVPVRSAWIGPKEWKDYSGQIYQIIDRAPASALPG